MKNQENRKQISDYGWLSKTQRSWQLWIGNPYCISCEIIPLKKATEEDLVKFARRVNAEEKRRFAKEFPLVQWKSFEGGGKKSVSG